MFKLVAQLFPDTQSTALRALASASASAAVAAAADFLEKTIGHFYRQPAEQSPAQGQQQLRSKEQAPLQQNQRGGWVPKSKAAFIQIPSGLFQCGCNRPNGKPGCVLHAHCLPRVPGGRVVIYLMPALACGGPLTHPLAWFALPCPAAGALRPLLLRTDAAGAGRHRRGALLRHRRRLQEGRAGVDWRPGIWLNYRGLQHRHDPAQRRLCDNVSARWSRGQRYPI